MYSTSPDEVLHGYSVLRVCLDDRNNDTVPIGVVAWDTPNTWQGWRWLQDDEKVRGVDSPTRQLMRITKNQIQRWAASKEVPYEPTQVEPTCAQFWTAVSEILTTSVRLDAPKAMEPMAQPSAEIELLFEAVVQPDQAKHHRRKRIDSSIREALGEMADRIPTGVTFSAYGDAREKVRRGLETDKGVLIVDGVNLAATEARKEADALVSRFLRIKKAYAGRPIEFVVGYASSPGGLKGEAHMCDWIRLQLTENVFDVVSQNDEFRRAAADAWERLEAGSAVAIRPIVESGERQRTNN